MDLEIQPEQNTADTPIALEATEPQHERNTLSSVGPVIALMVIILVVILGGLYLWGSMLSVEDLAPAPQTIKIPEQRVNSESIPIVTDETADWKTYTNAQYGFEFKYPSTSSLQIIDRSSVPSELFRVNIIGPEKGQYQGSPSYIGISVLDNSKQLSLIDWATTNSSFSNYGSDTLSTSFKNEILAGHKAISYSWVGMGDGKTVVIANSQTILLLDTIVDSKTDRVWQDFDGVLSTFKFTK